MLIGHSHGARVVAGYLAAHPAHVARAAFSSPAALDPTDTSAAYVTAGLDSALLAALYRRLLPPRNLLVYVLLQPNPAAAHNLAGDKEMDAQNDLVLALNAPGLHCPGANAEPSATGSGFYRLQYPQSLRAPVDRDIRDELAGNRTPALVIKGSCDYLSWDSAFDYNRTLANTRFVYLPAGHNA